MKSISKVFIWSVIVILLVAADGFSTNAIACNYYASPTGGGNGTSPSSPFRINNFWPVAGPGKMLCLLDGVYTDSITPPANLNGTASARITIKALNEGKVTIDGSAIRIPVNLNNNDYFVIEDINAKRGSCEVVHIGSGADNNVLRRMVAWDAKLEDNCSVWGINNNNNVLLEDVGGFGTGRKIFQVYAATNTTIRRAWGRWEGSLSIGPKSTFNLTYGGSNQLCENCIGTWDGIAGDQPQAIFRSGPTIDGSGTNPASDPKYYGSIAYLTDSQTSNLSRLVFFSEPTTGSYKDVATYISSNHAGKQPFNLLTGEFGPCTDCFLTNTTAIGGASSSIGTGFVITNRVIVSTPGAEPNLWSGSGSSGARVCKQYVNGTLTSTPLWPWPMNQRIIDATSAAGKTPVDVTRTMESIFGPIPSECRSGYATTVSSAPPSPSNLRAQ